MLNLRGLLQNRAVVLLGAGQLGKMTVDLWPRTIQKPILILDQTVEGNYKGIKVLPIQDHAPDPSRLLYVLCYFKESASKIQQLFFETLQQEIIICYDILTGFSPNHFSNGWIPQASREIHQRNERLFQDARSTEVLQNTLRWKFERDLDPAFVLSSESIKYDISRYGRSGFQYDSVLDFGAHHGSFFNSLMTAGISWKRAAAFEPDEESRRTLKDNLQGSASLENVEVHSEALWSSSGSQEFFGTDLLACRITSLASLDTRSVKTLTLQQALDKVNVSRDLPAIVKLHVEGAEYPVISQAFSARSDLSNMDILINLSHDEESLLWIPRILHTMGTHTLYLDSHSHFGEGLTLFARSTRWDT